MKKYDPHFDLEELTYEAEEIFKEFYCNYLAGNKEYITKVSTGPVAVLGAMIDLRKQEGWRFKFEELLDCGRANFLGAAMNEGVPTFTYSIEVQEFEAKINVIDGSDYVYKRPPPKNGEEQQKEEPVTENDRLMKATYRFVLARHQEPDVEMAGHYWEFIEF
jgi:hypothetical protein